MVAQPLPPSEGVAEAGAELHRQTPERILECFEAEDRRLLEAVAGAREATVRLGRALATALAAGGRIIHLGAGTSGRLAALDAAEWPPTFGLARARLRVLMAGGASAFERAVEGAEDDADGARAALDAERPGGADVIVGITASGSTPWVRAGLARARELAIPRALITTDPAALAGDPELIRVVLDTGAELLAGSTRLKAAAATHLVLQRASNLCAVELGWIHAGRMVEMRPTNAKLRRRAIGIVAELTGVAEPRAAELLSAAHDDIKVAIVCGRCGVDADEARRRLEAVDRRLAGLAEFR